MTIVIRSASVLGVEISPIFIAISPETPVSISSKMMVGSLE